ncbi:lysophospholipid acyltransferase family protein [Persephonella atlantica]|nr:lipid A biosynthesis acyltransferase [Persephonella atlantica]
MYLFAKTFFSFSSKLSRETALELGEKIGSTFWRLGYRKKVILKNLDIAFPEKEKEWKEKTGEKSLQSIGRTLVEFPKLPEYVKNKDIDRIFVIEEGEEILKEKGGKIIVSAHIGNWELGGAGISRKYGKIVSLAYRLKNKKLNSLITQIRESSGMKIIFHDQPLKDFLKALREGMTIVFLVDQNALRHRGVFVDFFSLPASTVSFPAKLSAKYGYPIIFSYQYYDFKTRIYKGVVKNLEIPDRKDVKSIVQSYTKEVEIAVRKHPEQYFWVHKRWKTRPEGEPENLYT